MATGRRRPSGVIHHPDRGSRVGPIGASQHFAGAGRDDGRKAAVPPANTEGAVLVGLGARRPQHAIKPEEYQSGSRHKSRHEEEVLQACAEMKPPERSLREVAFRAPTPRDPVGMMALSSTRLRRTINVASCGDANARDGAKRLPWNAFAPVPSPCRRSQPSRPKGAWRHGASRGGAPEPAMRNSSKVEHGFQVHRDRAIIGVRFHQIGHVRPPSSHDGLIGKRGHAMVVAPP